jgi:Rieske Fe-S protein
MERRTFIEICAVGGGCMAAGGSVASHADTPPPKPQKSGVVLKPTPFARVKLTDRDGRAIKAAALKTNHNYVFAYPFEGTPCFLLKLNRAAKAVPSLITERGDEYAWPGGVGPQQSIVAFSAICAHKLAYPSKQVSFISFRDKGTPLAPGGNVIGCCADKSVYDPFAGAGVLSGPAGQPLAAVMLEHDARTDELFAVAMLGANKFDEFFKKYEFKLSLEPAGAHAKEKVTGTTVVRDLAAHSQQTAQC